MKKIILSLLVLVVAASCQEQQKIAFIDNGQVIKDYQMKIDMEAKYKKKDEAYKRRTDSIGQAYQLDAQQTQLKLSSLSQKKQQEGSQQFSQKWQLIQQQLQYEQQQMEQAFSKEMDSVIKSVNEFVEGYGQKNGYTFILGKNGAGSVMFGKEEKDISEAVTKAINDDYNGKDSEEATTKTTEKVEDN
ncbi:OmpH family outer membrane protein [uncultured Winogradskyella sp.]|uniref:OmpH family outer membrane protein n=1 Tax=uncultured Winogradskyella sp. TaxID=395353 RepID=UPI00261C80EB|nr:OmpH family outer membrane protein [uncultured Winogradskyella sp.]